MTSTPAPSDMLSELSACAHRLGVAFAAEAEATEDWGRKLELVQLFDRCFFSVRVAINLQLRLRREGGARAAERHDVERAEGLEIERPEAAQDATRDDTYDERDRDRETERATLPLLLSTLNGIAKDAAALPGPAPAALPSLRDLLARVGAEPAATPRRPSPLPLRARLAGSAGLALASPPGPATGPPRANVATLVAPLARRPRTATGPPRR